MPELAREAKEHWQLATKSYQHPREWFTKDFWLLKPEHGALSDNLRWSNEDLDPVKESQRTWTNFDYATYWFCDNFSTANWGTATGILASGFTVREALPMGFFGYFIIGFFITLNGRAGAKYHISFPVFSRCSWGK